MILRPDQELAIRKVDELLALGRRPILQAPTGYGKGVVIAHYLTKYASEGRHVVMTVHRVELLRDTAARVRASTGLPVRMLAGVEPEGDSDALITVVGIDTMVARELLLPAELIIVDECHIAGAPTYQAALARYACPWLGLSATPQRENGVGMGACGFTDIVEGPQIQELVDAGLLADMDVYSADEESDALSEDPVAAWSRYAGGRPGLVFAASVRHSKELAALLTAAGYRAAHLDGTTAAPARKDIVSRFESGDIDILVTYRLLTTGLNVPRAKCIMLASRFTTPGTFLQALGRGRRFTGQTAVLIDLHGNWFAHGSPNAERHYSLEGRAVKLAEPHVAVQCPACYRWSETQGRCPCGMLLPPRPLPKVTKRELKLQAQRRDALRGGVDFELWKGLVAQGKANGYKSTWPALTYRRLRGRWPKWSVQVAEECTQ